MIADLARREDELGGKTLLIVGLGRIGPRLARLAKAFDMRVIGATPRPVQGSRCGRRGVGAGRARRAAAGRFRRAHLSVDAGAEGLIDAEALER